MWNNVWEDVFNRQAWGKYPAEPLIRFIAKNYFSSDRSDINILELGCGPGANLWFFAREGFSFFGIDGSASAIQQAAVRLDADCPDWRIRGRIETGDITEISLEDESYNCAVDNECVYCMPFSQSCEIYQNVWRILKPGGKLFIRTFATDSWGYGSGRQIESDYYECTEGPLANKGYSRFTSESQIKILLSPFRQISIEKTSMSHLNQTREVVEWIIEATK